MCHIYSHADSVSWHCCRIRAAHRVLTGQYMFSVAHLFCRLRLKCDDTRTETRFCLSAKRMSPFKPAEGGQFKSTTGSRGVRISGSNAGYTMFRGSVKGTGYSLHLPVSPSLPLPCVTVCHHISTGLCLLVVISFWTAYCQAHVGVLCVAL